MEVDKENWLPMPSKKQQLARRRSTGIMKGGDSTGSLISPKAKKRSRLEMINKRVSFGVVDVRLYEKDTDWTASPAEKNAARSVDVGSVPFNDNSPVIAPSIPDKSMLRALVDDDDDDDDEQTMEMTVNHGRIISEVLSGKSNLSTLVDDDESECPGSPLTMDLTINYSKIMQNKQEEEETMEMTVNHSKIVSAEPVIINVITSPKLDGASRGLSAASSKSPSTPKDRPIQRFLTSSPEEGISFSISTPPEALKPASGDIHHEFELLSPSRRSFIDHDQTTDLTRNFQHHIGSIVAGGDDGEKTVDLARLASQMTEHEAKVAMEFKRILNSEADTDTTTNIAVQLDNVDDFLSNIRSPEVSKEALKEQPKIATSPVCLPAIHSVEAFLSYVQVRFMDTNNSSRKTLSIGYTPSGEALSEKERLQLACIQLPILQNLQQSVTLIDGFCSKLSSEIKEMEDWLNSQAPVVFTKFLQLGDERLIEGMQRLRQACKLQNKIKWCEHRSRQEESLHAILNERIRQLISDKNAILDADTQIREIMQEQKLHDDKLIVLRTAIENQANNIDELNNDLEHLRKTKTSLSLNLKHLELAVKKQASLASKKESWRRDEVSLIARSRELYFLQACFDWKMTKCSESDLTLSYGFLCSLVFQISGNGTGSVLSAKFVRQKSGSEIWAALVKANESYVNLTLQQAGNITQLPPLLNKLSLRLGRMRSLEMEIQRIMTSYTILVEPSPSDFLLNITICSQSPMSSVTFTVRIDVGLFATKPVSLVEIRLLLGPDNCDNNIREIIESTSGFGSLTKICSAILAML